MEFTIKYLIIGLLGLTASASSLSNTIHTEFPSEINPNGNYVFYSHGFIVEGTNPKPVEQRHGWGIYDFPAVKQALSDKSHELIAYHRPKDTNPYEFSYKLAGDVRKLVSAGVAPSNITLIGFSRGAFITAVTSHNLANVEVNTVLLAGCGRFASDRYKNMSLYGKALSIYETTDVSASCKKLEKRSPELKVFDEIAITTGLSHGAFYRPKEEWVKPIKNWIKKHSVKVNKL